MTKVDPILAIRIAQTHAALKDANSLDAQRLALMEQDMLKLAEQLAGGEQHPMPTTPPDGGDGPGVTWTAEEAEAWKRVSPSTDDTDGWGDTLRVRPSDGPFTLAEAIVYADGRSSLNIGEAGQAMPGVVLRDLWLTVHAHSPNLWQMHTHGLDDYVRRNVLVELAGNLKAGGEHNLYDHDDRGGTDLRLVTRKAEGAGQQKSWGRVDEGSDFRAGLWNLIESVHSNNCRGPRGAAQLTVYNPGPDYHVIARGGLLEDDRGDVPLLRTRASDPLRTKHDMVYAPKFHGFTSDKKAAWIEGLRSTKNPRGIPDYTDPRKIGGTWVFEDYEFRFPVDATARMLEVRGWTEAIFRGCRFPEGGIVEFDRPTTHPWGWYGPDTGRVVFEDCTGGTTIRYELEDVASVAEGWDSRG